MHLLPDKTKAHYVIYIVGLFFGVRFCTLWGFGCRNLLLGSNRFQVLNFTRAEFLDKTKPAQWQALKYTTYFLDADSWLG